MLLRTVCQNYLLWSTLGLAGLRLICTGDPKGVTERPSVQPLALTKALSQALFAIGIADALSAVNARLRELNPAAQVFSYLDDVVVAVPAACAEEDVTVVTEELT